MKIQPTEISDVLLIKPQVYGDHRGFFFESFNQRVFLDKVYSDKAEPIHFVQDNHSRSKQGILRGLHYQIQQPQGKLVRVVIGAIFDVAVDIRKQSTTFGQWIGATLSAENKHQLWVPPGFAHGFFVLSDNAEVLYKATDYYAPEHERSIIWNDPDLGIVWPLKGITPILSSKDEAGVPFKQADVYP
ncbi:MAG: dTDP-4-dehydrorhamnose 3,5-epimerase [Cyanobacteria bacterium J06635_15]